MLSIPSIGTAILIGVAATAIMDAWLLALSRMGMSAPDWALVGRWVGLMRHGQFRQASISKAPRVRGEHALGWITHYAVGIAYAVALLALAGAGWASKPTFLPALLFGFATVVVPLFVMQPWGWASRAPGLQVPCRHACAAWRITGRSELACTSQLPSSRLCEGVS